MEVLLIKSPTEEDWMEAKQCALVTAWKDVVKNKPDSEWKHAILRARHSPIRILKYRFLIKGVPSWVSVHICRHVHLQPFVASQRNDRQSMYDRNKAPQDSPVNMIVDCNAEMLMTLANKRLCMQASKETRELVREMCKIAEEHTPEFKGLLVPMCERLHGHCEEMRPCGRFPNDDYRSDSHDSEGNDQEAVNHAP